MFLYFALFNPLPNLYNIQLYFYTYKLTIIRFINLVVPPPAHCWYTPLGYQR